MLAGDAIKAKKAYQDFLALWKDADPDVSVLIEARKEYAAVQRGRRGIQFGREVANWGLYAQKPEGASPEALSGHVSVTR
jgi:hypothetical protein